MAQQGAYDDTQSAPPPPGHVCRPPPFPGFSGVLFGLIVVETAQSGAPTCSILGLFSVPSPYFPWALLVFWQLLMPSVSFLGHLCGVLVRGA